MRAADLPRFHTYSRVIRRTDKDGPPARQLDRPSCFVRHAAAASRIAGACRSTRVAASAGDLMRPADIADGGRIDPIDVDIFSGLMRSVAIREASAKTKRSPRRRWLVTRACVRVMRTAQLVNPLCAKQCNSFGKKALSH